MTYTPINLPPDEIIEAIHAPVTRVTRRVDIYESDRVTPWALDVGVVDGSVNISLSRDERRVGDFVFDNENGLFKPDSDAGFWYDKIIKVYRGVRTRDMDWEAQIAELRIDGFQEKNSSSEMSVKCRDYTKDLIGAEFPLTTTFPENHPIEEAIRDIAISGGIPANQIDFPLTGESLGREYTFEAGGPRWTAMKDISVAYGYEVYFTGDGMLTMRQHQDPFTLPPAYTFKTGVDGNLGKYDKSATDALLRNHIVAVGESSSSDIPPVWFEIANTRETSPTRVQRIGYRTHRITSPLIETFAQAEDVATRALRSMAMEQFQVSMEAFVLPYMDVGVVVQFDDPNPAEMDPNKYLMQEMTIPYKLGPMPAQAGRITDVGED